MRRSIGLPKAFVLITVELGTEGEFVAELKRIDKVAEVYEVYGPYDLVAEVEADTMEEVKETITWRIRHLEKVRSTVTLLVVG
jgi:DNA-binding Lrp family transcriptional regulator